MRPKQWVKNLLVTAAPIAAGVIHQELSYVLLGVLGFSLASSIGYLTNDWLDQDLDRLHPTKRHRPFASNKLSLSHLILLLFFCISGILIICSLLPKPFSAALVAYLLVTLTYSFGIKKIPVVEIIWLSSGFLIRAVAGSAIIGEYPTGWFVISVLFGSIFIVSTKRLAEVNLQHTELTRIVLSRYTQEFLKTSISVSLGVTMMTYLLWVFEVHPDSMVAQSSVIPFSLMTLSYAFVSEGQNGESPEDLFYKNPLIIGSALTTVLCLAWVLYG